MRITGMQLLIVGMMFLGAGQATDAAVVLNHAEGVWANPTGGDLGTINYLYDVGDAYGSGRRQEIRWGNPDTSAGQSGLGFTGVAGPAKQVEIGEPFDISQLTHFNNVVEPGTACEYLELVVALNFENGSPSQFQFSFQIDETHNKDGEPYSRDTITFPDARRSRPITIDGADYTLELLGFGQDGHDFQDSFVTPEGELNSTRLWANLVPEPATVLLFGAGALAFLRKRS